MITRKVSRGVAVLAAPFLLIGMVAALSGLGERTSSSPANAVSGEPASVAVSECPTGEEIQAYWEQHGEDLKSAGTCGDPDPVPPGDSGEQSADVGHSHDAKHAHEPTTLGQAQELLDPADDPLVYIGKDSSGRWFAVHVTLAPGEQEPPARVRTVHELAAWFDARRTQ